ncbi:MAG: phosphotransferase [Bacteroidaceae bacterium]|nr:phosphotransferase [Bacteroidaceae bacterium]
MARDEILESLYETYSGVRADSSERLTQSGSDREYFRMKGQGGTVIGVVGTSAEENRAFCSICRHFNSKGLPVPSLLAVSGDFSRYLQSDLGDLSLYDALEQCRTSGVYDPQSVTLLEKVVRILPDFQFKGAEGMDFTICYPVGSFDHRSVMWDLNYFKYCFLKPSGVEFHEARLENGFEALASMLLEGSPYDTFMYRDFQSRNIMVCNGEPWFIDFQGGRRGPVMYDIVSFLWQARAAYPEELRSHLLDVYIDSVSRYIAIDRAAFSAKVRLFTLFRTLQVLGAYGYRGNFERKSAFLQSVPQALANLGSLLDILDGDSLQYLASVLLQLIGLPRYSQMPSIVPDILTVRITSFSFRKGIPEDCSGNGGGFVFDCRSMKNPGLYDRYKMLDGTSPEVIGFLDSQGEIQKYMESVIGLVDPAVEKYLSRGFTNLAVNFGCTGGRHRSVCCAERLATHLHDVYGNRIKVLLHHREMKSTREL